MPLASFSEVHAETALLVRSLVCVPPAELTSNTPQLENSLDFLVMLYTTAWIFVFNW